MAASLPAFIFYPAAQPESFQAEQRGYLYRFSGSSSLLCFQ